MKKKFEELQKGDKMYYWDHGKIHVQYVHDAEIVDQTSTSTDWYGATSTVTRRVLNIKAGPDMNRLTSTYSWILLDNKFRYLSEPEYVISVRGTKRFSCIEAVEHWLKQRIAYTERKALMYKARYDAMNNCNKKYIDTLDNLYG